MPPITQKPGQPFVEALRGHLASRRLRVINRGPDAGSPNWNARLANGTECQARPFRHGRHRHRNADSRHAMLERLTLPVSIPRVHYVAFNATAKKIPTVPISCTTLAGA